MQPQFNNNLIDKIQKHRVKNQVHLMIQYLLESPLKQQQLQVIWIVFCMTHSHIVASVQRCLQAFSNAQLT